MQASTHISKEVLESYVKYVSLSKSLQVILDVANDVSRCQSEVKGTVGNPGS